MNKQKRGLSPSKAQLVECCTGIAEVMGSNQLFIASRVYTKPTYFLAPSWLVSSVGRVLHRYRIGQGFKSCTGLIFFFTPCFHYCSSSVHYCKDRFHIHVFIRSSHILFLYIYSHLFITLRVYMEPTY